MVIHQHFSALFPRARTAVLTTLDRITAPVTDFIRGNPIVSTAAIGIGTTGLITGIAAVRRIRRKKKKAKAGRKKKVGRKRKKVATFRRRTRRRAKKKRTHASPRHKGHKRVSFTTADGRKVNFLVKKKHKKHHK